MDRLCHYGPQSGCMGRNLASTLIVESEVGNVIAIYGFFSHKPRCCYNWAANDCEAILQIGIVKGWLMKGGWQEYGSPYVLTNGGHIVRICAVDDEGDPKCTTSEE